MRRTECCAVIVSGLNGWPSLQAPPCPAKVINADVLMRKPLRLLSPPLGPLCRLDDGFIMTLAGQTVPVVLSPAPQFASVVLRLFLSRFWF